MQNYYDAAVAIDGSLSHLSTEQLLAGARSEVIADDPDTAVPYLVALNDRATQDVFDSAAQLLPADDPIERELGVRILRELGCQDETGRRPFSTQAIPLLRLRLDNEPEAYLLTCVISALSFNSAREALSDVLRFTDHPHDGVRFTVAAGLPSLINPTCVEPAALDALTRLSHDDDADTRWYALYALVNEVAGADPRVLSQAVADRLDDPDDQVRGLARECHYSGQRS